MDKILENGKEVVGTVGLTSPEKKPSHTKFREILTGCTLFNILGDLDYLT